MALHRGSSSAGVPGRSSNALVTEANPALGERLTPPRHRLGDDPVPPDVAYQLIHDELLLDGSARLNLATFVTSFPADREDLSVLRVVCRNGFSHDLADLFLADLRAVAGGLSSPDQGATGRSGFHH